ncbi:MAG: hypothetical protein H7234_08950 [Herminiimonas sp.]|nr:hypothetical protein [Herminiimonas sp.]
MSSPVPFWFFTKRPIAFKKLLWTLAPLLEAAAVNANEMIRERRLKIRLLTQENMKRKNYASDIANANGRWYEKVLRWRLVRGNSALFCPYFFVTIIFSQRTLLLHSEPYILLHTKCRVGHFALHRVKRSLSFPDRPLQNFNALNALKRLLPITTNHSHMYFSDFSK